MVHAAGIARITYPRAVQRSSADPATSVNLPARILAVPGRANQPIRLGQSPDDFYDPLIRSFKTSAQVLELLRQSERGITSPPPAPAPAPFPDFPLLAAPSTVPQWVWWAGAGVAGLGLMLMLTRSGSGPAARR